MWYVSIAISRILVSINCTSVQLNRRWFVSSVLFNFTFKCYNFCLTISYNLDLLVFGDREIVLGELQENVYTISILVVVLTNACQVKCKEAQSKCLNSRR